MPESAALSGSQPLRVNAGMHLVGSSCCIDLQAYPYFRLFLQQQQKPVDDIDSGSISDSFLSRMQGAPDTIKLIFDDMRHGGDSSSREDLMRTALQKKRWIEMQLHAVSSARCLKDACTGT